MRFQGILALLAITSTSLVFAAPVAAPEAVAEAAPVAAPEPEAKAEAADYGNYGS
jgi:hypothetical protein